VKDQVVLKFVKRHVDDSLIFTALTLLLFHFLQGL